MYRRQIIILISICLIGCPACSTSDFETVKFDFQSSDLQQISNLVNIQLPQNSKILVGYLFSAKNNHIVFRLEVPVNELDSMRQSMLSLKAPAVLYDAKLHSSHPALSLTNPIVENYAADGVHILICKSTTDYVEIFIEAFSPPYRQEFNDARELIRK